MTAIRLLPGHLSVGPVLAFVACALGQAVGSPIIGLFVGKFGYADSFAMFAAAGIFISLLSPLYPGRTELESGAPEDESGLQAAYDYQLQNDEGEPLEMNTPEEAEQDELKLPDKSNKENQ